MWIGGVLKRRHAWKQQEICLAEPRSHWFWHFSVSLDLFMIQRRNVKYFNESLNYFWWNTLLKASTSPTIDKLTCNLRQVVKWLKMEPMSCFGLPRFGSKWTKADYRQRWKVQFCGTCTVLEYFLPVHVTKAVTNNLSTQCVLLFLILQYI